MDETSQPSQPSQPNSASIEPSQPNGRAQGDGFQVRPVSHQDKRERIIAALRERSPQAPAPAELPRPTGEGSPLSESKEKAPKSDDSEYALRLSRMQRELRDARADAVEATHKARALDALGEKLGKARGDAYALVNLLPELIGMDFGQLADYVVENESKFREQQRFAQLPREIREELDLARRERLERQRQREVESQRAYEADRFAGYRDSTKAFLEENRDEYPLSYAIGWAPEQIARAALERGTRDARGLLEELEGNLREQFSAAMSNEAIVGALVGRDAAIAEKLSKFLGGRSNKGMAAASMRSGEQAYRSGADSLSNHSVSSDTSNYQSKREQRRQALMRNIRPFFDG